MDAKPGVVAEIRDLLTALSAHERRLLLVRVCCEALGLTAAGLILAAAAASMGAPAWLSAPLAWISLVAGPLTAGLRSRKAWSTAARPLHQARSAESVEPALAERLITIAGILEKQPETATEPPVGGLLRLAAERAAASLRGIDPARVHPRRLVRPAGIFAATGGLALLLATLLFPVAPLDALAWARTAPGTLAPTEVAPVDGRAMVGDITLRYIFPERVGAEPVVIHNSDGTIHAPPGTRVEIEARTLHAFDSAMLEVPGGERLEVQVQGGRNLRATLTVSQPGIWRFALQNPQGEQLSPDFRLEVDEDAAPVVALERAPAPALPADRPLGIAWSVQDDFGISKVVLEVETEDGTITEHVLREPLEPVRELRGRIGQTARELGLPIGKPVKLRVVAYDTDLGGGVHKGQSTEMEVTALGPQGQASRLTAYYRDLRDALIPLLAAHLLDPSPPATDAAGMNAWVAKARTRLDPLIRLREAHWAGAPSSAVDGPLLDALFDSSGRLYRFALTTWEQGSTRRITTADEEELLALQTEVTGDIEQALFVIDMTLRNVASQNLAKAAEQAAAEAEELAARAETADAAELLSRLDELERLMAEVQKATAELSDAELKEFVNSRLSESKKTIDDIRKAIAEGRLDDARADLQRLAEQLRQMSESINDQAASRQAKDDALAKALEETKAGMKKLEEDQRQLADELAKAREEHGGAVDELVQLWQEADRLASALRQGLDTLRATTGDGRGWRIDTLRRIERVAGEGEGLQDAVASRNAEAALDRARGLRPLVDTAGRMIASERNRARGPAEPLPEDLSGQSKRIAKASTDRAELEQVLLKLAERSDQDPPELQQAARELANRQQQLAERQRSLEESLEKVERAIPTAQGEATKAMKAAGESMERAQDSLSQGRALQGEGDQRAAADGIAKALERLDEALQQQRQMQQTQGRMQGERQPQPGDGDQESGEDDGNGVDENARVAIPAPEEFRTPEEYRRALLEGMSGDVPSEYEALKQRYFEELVQQ